LLWNLVNKAFLYYKQKIINSAYTFIVDSNVSLKQLNTKDRLQRQLKVQIKIFHCTERDQKLPILGGEINHFEQEIYNKGMVMTISLHLSNTDEISQYS
jgi:hypothetical protein